MRFAYVYFMAETADAPERVRETVPRHVAYWRGHPLAHYVGGPFADRSGGLITFEARSAAEADTLVANDPFVRAGVLARHWTKEWAVE